MSLLYTARNTHPWPWKSANWVFAICGFSLMMSFKKAGSPQLPRAAVSSGLSMAERVSCSLVGFFSFGGYIRCPSVSWSHHMYPM